MAFESYERNQNEYSDPVTVLYPSSKNFTFLSSDVDMLPDSEYFEYLVDADEMLLGFEPVDEPTDNSYKAVRTEYTVQFSASGVLHEFGVDIRDLNDSVAFPIEKDGDRVVADLSEFA